MQWNTTPCFKLQRSPQPFKVVENEVKALRITSNSATSEIKFMDEFNHVTSNLSRVATTRRIST